MQPLSSLQSMYTMLRNAILLTKQDYRHSKLRILPPSLPLFHLPVLLSGMTWMPVTSRRSTQTCSRSTWTSRWIPGTSPAPRLLLGRASKPRASTPKSFSPLVMNSRRSSANLVGGIPLLKPGSGVRVVSIRFAVSPSVFQFSYVCFFSALKPIGTSIFLIEMYIQTNPQTLICAGKPELPRQPGSSAFYDSESSQPAQTPEGSNATEPESPVSTDSNANNFFQTLDWEGTVLVFPC